MAERKKDKLAWLALASSLGGVAVALVAAVGTGAGAWNYAAGLQALGFALGAAVLGGLLAIAALIARRRSWVSVSALGIALLFTGYLGRQIMVARSVPAIHDVATDLRDLPRFGTLPVRTDNLENVPDQGRPELAAMDPEDRWKALHRQGYPDLRPLRLSSPPPEVLRRAEQLVRARGWELAVLDRRGGTLEATATTFFFRFKDDIVIRVRPDPARAGGSIVDMRSISRVGLSDIGVNAARIRAFLHDLEASPE